VVRAPWGAPLSIMSCVCLLMVRRVEIVPWVTGAVTHLLFVWLKHKGEFEEVLQRTGLIELEKPSEQELIPFWYAIQLLHEMVRRYGPKIPMVVADDDRCFEPIGRVFLSGTPTLSHALLRAVENIPTHCSHLEMDARFDRTGRLLVSGKVKGSWNLDYVHEAQLFIIATLRRICIAATSPKPPVLDRVDLSKYARGEATLAKPCVFDRVELTRYARGEEHLRDAGFGKIVTRSDRRFVVSVPRVIARRPCSQPWRIAERTPLHRRKVPLPGMWFSCLAVGENMNGLVTLDRLAAAIPASVRTVQRRLGSREELLATILYNKENKLDEVVQPHWHRRVPNYLWLTKRGFAFHSWNAARKRQVGTSTNLP
jgi:hypothetical protein